VVVGGRRVDHAAILQGARDDGADHRVQARAVAAAGQQAEAHHAILVGAGRMQPARGAGVNQVSPRLDL
jgi:hypothetical protein